MIYISPILCVKISNLSLEGFMLNYYKLHKMFLKEYSNNMKLGQRYFSYFSQQNYVEKIGDKEIIEYGEILYKILALWNLKTSQL